MTGPSEPPATPGGLQFDKVGGAESAMMCAMCKVNIQNEYYHLNGKPICASCKVKADTQIAQMRSQGTSKGAMSKAVLYGLGAAIAGAIVYFAVSAITGLEIGIVAIVIGYMVGWSMRKATGGVGGRRYQVLAVAFTYLAVAMAYAALGVREVVHDSKEHHSTSHMIAATRDSAAHADSTETADSVAIASVGTARSDTKKRGISGAAILGILGLMLALPVMAIFASGTGGILSAIIIGVGLRQAWQMTRGAEIKIAGPFKIGSAARVAAT